MTYDDIRKIPGADSTVIQHVGTCVQTSAHQTPDEQTTMIKKSVLSRQEVLRIWGGLFLIWKVWSYPFHITNVYASVSSRTKMQFLKMTALHCRNYCTHCFPFNWYPVPEMKVRYHLYHSNSTMRRQINFPHSINWAPGFPFYQSISTDDGTLPLPTEATI